jgi:hypothetical protein
MPVHYRAQVIVPQDSSMPKDVLTINPCFRDSGATSNPQNLADDLALAMSQFFSGGGAHVIVKLYDLEGTVPIYPAAVGEVNATVQPRPSAMPREIACCLSFYATHNRPSSRGRLYVPMCGLYTVTKAELDVRPTQAVQQAVGALPQHLQDLGGPDVDWIVWSKKNRTAGAVTNWFVDNEWDTIRSRGLKGTDRLTGTTSEA